MREALLTTQTGKIGMGAYGLTLKIQLLPPADPQFNFDLNNATAGTIDFQRPDGTTWSYALVVPADIIDPINRIVRYVTQPTDLPIFGRYEFTLTIDGGPNERLVAEGSFYVEETH
jgi:hypothetical protein